MSKVSAIIPAAGSGRRMGGDKSKQYLRIGGNPILVETLLLFEHSPLIDEIVLPVPAGDIPYVEGLVRSEGFGKVTRVVAGGEERQDSILNALDCLNAETEIVVIHDGVRPFLPAACLAESIVTARTCGAAVVAVPVKDTVKEAGTKGEVARTVPRASLWLAQTPQTFRYAVIREAFDHALSRGIRGTDDASLVEAMGGAVQIVRGSYENIKITTPEDLIFAEAILKERKRCGQG